MVTPTSSSTISSLYLSTIASVYLSTTTSVYLSTTTKDNIYLQQLQNKYVDFPSFAWYYHFVIIVMIISWGLINIKIKVK